MASQHNDPLNDLATDMNTPRPVVAGGTGHDTLREYASDLLRTSFRVTAGGTADAITLTTGLSLTSLTSGMEFRFRATGNNTGAFTINVDGIGAQPGKTIESGVAPSGYVRTGVETRTVWDGTNFVTDRITQIVTNANGTAVLYANGICECYHSISDTSGVATASGSVFTSAADISWTYPFAFTSLLGVNLEIQRSGRPGGVSMWDVPGLTSLTFRPWLATTLAATNAVTVYLEAQGRWYS